MQAEEWFTNEVIVSAGVDAIRALRVVCSPEIAHLEDKLCVELPRRLEVGKDVLKSALEYVPLNGRTTKEEQVPNTYCISSKYPALGGGELRSASAQVVEPDA
jgi:hypothetical protein